MRLWAPFVLATGLFVSACGGSSTQTTPSASTEDIGEVIAVVNGMPVGAKEFERAAARTVPTEGETLSDADRKEIVDRLVAEKLLYQEALEKGLDKDPKVQKVMINTLLREDVYGQVKNSDFTDEVLQAYYDAHPEEFVVPEKVQIKRILIRVNDERPDEQARALAEQVRSELAADPKEKFKDVAGRHSEDTYRRRGGDVGYVSREGKPGLDQAVVDKAFEMAPETLSEVFKSDEGYNIVYVAGKRERVERTFAQMKGAVLRKVKNERLKELYDQYVAQLRQGANVTLNEDRVAAIDIKHAARQALPPGMQLNPVLANPAEGLGPDADEGAEEAEAAAEPEE